MARSWGPALLVGADRQAGSSRSPKPGSRCAGEQAAAVVAAHAGVARRGCCATACGWKLHPAVTARKSETEPAGGVECNALMGALGGAEEHRRNAGVASARARRARTANYVWYLGRTRSRSARAVHTPALNTTDSTTPAVLLVCIMRYWCAHAACRCARSCCKQVKVPARRSACVTVSQPRSRSTRALHVRARNGASALLATGICGSGIVGR